MNNSSLFPYKKVMVTGAAGFIGSNLVDKLLSLGIIVIGYDNFSTGIDEFLINANNNINFKFIRGDTLDIKQLTSAMSDCEFVFHLAANADVRFGLEYPRKDLEQNTIATFNVLESCRINKVKGIAFSSTGSVYGETKIFPTPEDCPFPIQTSLYGASKLAGESLLQAYSEGYGLKSYIFRFVSILGERYTHGHVFDFYRQLKQNPKELKVLGDGHQKKSYLYVQDCIDAIIMTVNNIHEKVNIFNLGCDEYCEVNDSIKWICDKLNVNPIIQYSGGERGWVGDNPLIFLDTKKIRSIGWKNNLTIQQGIIKTVEYLNANLHILDKR